MYKYGILPEEAQRSREGQELKPGLSNQGSTDWPLFHKENDNSSCKQSV